MLRTDRYAAIGVLLAAALALACELASITEARSQLRRGGARLVQFNMPLADTSITVDVGSKLKFNNLTFTPFNFSFNQMLQTAQQTVSVSAPAPPVYGPDDGIYAISGPPTTFATPGGSTVSSATAGTGLVTRSITNQTGCLVTGFTSSLLDAANNTVFSFNPRDLPDSPTPAVDAVLIDTIPGGVTFSSSMKVDVPVPNFGACVPSPGATVATSITVGPMTLTQVTLQNVNETFSQTFNAFAGEPRITAVDIVVVASRTVCGPLPSCSFSLTVQNKLPIADVITVRLNGITKAGVVQQQQLTVPAANGTGGTTSATLTFDLADAQIIPAAVIPQVTGTATATTATITPTNATNAVVVSGGGNLVIESISGKLDPAVTPELTVSLDTSQVLPDDSTDFGNLSNETSVDSATAKLDIVNTSGVPLQLSNFSLRAAQTDAAGQPLKDGSGNVIYEKNASGNPITLTVADPGTTSFTVGRATTRSVSLAAGPLLDRVLHLFLDNKRVALVATGTVVVGDKSQSTISRTDFVKVRFRFTVGVTITTPGPQ